MSDDDEQPDEPVTDVFDFNLYQSHIGYGLYVVEPSGFERPVVTRFAGPTFHAAEASDQVPEDPSDAFWHALYCVSPLYPDDEEDIEDYWGDLRPAEREIVSAFAKYTNSELAAEFYSDPVIAVLQRYAAHRHFENQAPMEGEE